MSVLLAVRVTVMGSDTPRSPEPEMVFDSVTSLVRLKMIQPLLVMAPCTDPVVPPVPSCSSELVPIVVPPPYVSSCARAT